MSVSKSDVDQLVRNCVLGADMVLTTHVTMAERTRQIVEAALRFAVGNGLVEIVDNEDWPSMWLVMDPDDYPIKIEENDG